MNNTKKDKLYFGKYTALGHKGKLDNKENNTWTAEENNQRDLRANQSIFDPRKTVNGHLKTIFPFRNQLK